MFRDCLGHRFRLLRWGALLAATGSAMMLAGATGLAARPHSHTSIKYYTITGPDDRSLDVQMARFGPTHRGGHAYATLSADPTFKGRLVAGKYCRLRDFRVNASFVMTLPRLRPGVKLSAATRARWSSFSAFVRRHEEHHKTIWLGCLARGEARALRLRISDCDTLDRAVQKVFKQEWGACEKKQDAFDAAQQIRLKSQPLIVAAGRFSHKVALRRTRAAPTVKVNFRGGFGSQ